MAKKRLVVYSTEPDKVTRVIVDMLDGSQEAINELIAQHNYKVGEVDPLFGNVITEVDITDLSE